MRRPAAPRHVRAVAFDMFTIFDPRGVERRAAEVIPDDAAHFSATWMSRLFEYCWLHAVAQRYVPFDRLAADALAYATHARNLELTDAELAHLAGAFTQLQPWPDARDVLQTLRDRGLRLAPLANFAPPMINELLAGAHLIDLFDAQISTDAAQTYKPDPRAYALAEHRLATPRDNIAFAAFARWDAWGAATFGLRTFWVNRLAAGDELGGPVASGSDLGHLAEWLTSGATTP